MIKKARELLKNVYFSFIDYTKAFDCVNHNKLWKNLKATGIPDYHTCLLRNLYVSQEATVKTGHRTTYWFQIGKGAYQGYILSQCFSSVQSLSCAQLFATPWTITTRLLCPWYFPGKNPGVGCHFLLQETFLTKGLNPGLPHCRQMLYCLSYQGSPNTI